MLLLAMFIQKTKPLQKRSTHLENQKVLQSSRKRWQHLYVHACLYEKFRFWALVVGWISFAIVGTAVWQGRESFPKGYDPLEILGLSPVIHPSIFRPAFSMVMIVNLYSHAPTKKLNEDISSSV